MSTLRKTLEGLMVGGSTAREAAAVAGCNLSYAQTVRRALVFEGKVAKGQGRGRPAQKGAGR